MDKHPKMVVLKKPRKNATKVTGLYIPPQKSDNEKIIENLSKRVLLDDDLETSLREGKLDRKMIQENDENMIRRAKLKLAQLILDGSLGGGSSISQPSASENDLSSQPQVDQPTLVEQPDVQPTLIEDIQSETPKDVKLDLISPEPNINDVKTVEDAPYDIVKSVESEPIDKKVEVKIPPPPKKYRDRSEVHFDYESLFKM